MKKVILFFNDRDNESAISFIYNNIKEVYEDHIELTSRFLSDIDGREFSCLQHLPERVLG